MKLATLGLLAVLSGALLSSPAHAVEADPGGHPKAVLEKYDTNGNGVLDADELEQLEADRAAGVAVVRVGVAPPPHPKKPLRKLARNRLDVNNNGKVDPAERKFNKPIKHCKPIKRVKRARGRRR